MTPPLYIAGLHGQDVGWRRFIWLGAGWMGEGHAKGHHLRWKREDGAGEMLSALQVEAGGCSPEMRGARVSISA